MPKAAPNTAVILARGLGKRMRQHDESAVLNATQAESAESGVKGMISVGRPFLDYVLSALADADILDVVLVIGPEHSTVREYFEHASPPERVHVRFAIQDKPIGTADAVVAAAAVVGDKSFVVLNADNYYPVQAYRELTQIDGAAVIAFDRDALVRESNIDANRVRAFAILDIAPDGVLQRIIEKPGDSVDLNSSTTTLGRHELLEGFARSG